MWFGNPFPHGLCILLFSITVLGKDPSIDLLVASKVTPLPHGGKQDYRSCRLWSQKKKVIITL